VKNYAYITTALSNKNGSGDEVFKDLSYDKLKEIIKENQTTTL